MPRIKNEKVENFIREAEVPKPIELSTYVHNFENQLPKIRGLKAHAISGIVRDLDETNRNGESNVFLGQPQHGVSSAEDIDPEELEPHYFTPNFFRPIPEAEDDPDLDSTSPHDCSSDVSLS